VHGAELDAISALHERAHSVRADGAGGAGAGGAGDDVAGAGVGS